MIPTNAQRYCYVDYTGIPYVDRFGIPNNSHQNYVYKYQPENRARTIVRSNQPNRHIRPNHLSLNPHKLVESFKVDKKESDCGCDDE